MHLSAPVHRFAKYLLLSATMMLTAALTLDTASAQTADQGQAVSKTRLTDGDIIQIVRSLNQGEVVTSEPAVQQAQNDKVKQYAQQMVDAHRKAVQELDTMAQQNKLKARPNEISHALEDTVQGITEKLGRAEGSEFDTQYMEMQLSLHQTALSMLDYTLIPRVQNDQLRQHLIEMRMKIDQHLNNARDLYRSL